MKNYFFPGGVNKRYKSCFVASLYAGGIISAAIMPFILPRPDDGRNQLIKFNQSHVLRPEENIDFSAKDALNAKIFQYVDKDGNKHCQLTLNGGRATIHVQNNSAFTCDEVLPAIAKAGK